MISLLELPHRDARELARSGAPITVFVNPVEFHGPHLSLHNDALVSQGLARELHAQLSIKHPEWPLVVVNDVEIGMDPTPGAGTRHYPFAMVKSVVLETCRALMELGARRVIFQTFHGAPMHNMALDAGVKFLLERGVRAISPFNVILKEMVEFQNPAEYAPAFSHIPSATADRMLASLNLDFHAGFFETSMALHHAPLSVSTTHRELPDCPPFPPESSMLMAGQAARLVGRHGLARELEFAAYGMGWRALRPFPGYTGAPSLLSLIHI